LKGPTIYHSEFDHSIITLTSPTHKESSRYWLLTNILQ